ncbi:MAG: hypothetical protein VKJ06_05745 [Vampirovibrionales bacterium]|nr:hypothetical protein [Vampirovibrionales bacterium]
MNNIYPFRPKNGQSGRATAARGSRWPGRFLCVAAYLLVAFKFEPTADVATTLLMLLGLGYWAIIHHRRVQTAYETRFHLLQSLMLMLFSAIVFQILVALCSTLMYGFVLVGLGDLSYTIWGALLGVLPLIARFTLLAFGLVGAYCALKGECRALPWIGLPIKNWA